MTRQPYEAFEKAVRLSSKFDENFVELGHLLKHLKDTEPALFKQVCEETSLGDRKAMYLVKIARRTEHLPIPKGQMAKVGWTRMEIVANQLTPSTWKHWMATAETHTARDLRIILKGKRPVPGTRTIVLHLAPQDYASFEKVLLMNGAKANGLGMLNKERALMSVISAFGVRAGKAGD